MDIMELMYNLDNFLIVNGNTLKYNGNKYTNYAIYGDEEDKSIIVTDYLNDRNVKYVLIDLKNDLEIDLIQLAKDLVQKEGVLLIKGYGDTDNLARWRFSAIYKDLSINGAKINYLGTIVFMNKNKFKLDFNEEDCFTKLY